jgi:cytochrome c553
MINATRDITKRKRAGQAGTPVMVRLQPAQLASLDRWIAKQPDPKPSRPEAVRQLIAEKWD